MSEFKDKLIQASKLYAEQTVIRAGVNAIPFVGGSIDILLSSSGQNFVIRRIENFIHLLNGEISKLREDKINAQFLNSEPGFDLIIKAFNSASRTRQHEKLMLYARIVRSAFTIGKEFEEDDPEMFLRIAEDLTVKELRVAKCLFDLKEENEKSVRADAPQKEDRGDDDAAWLSNRYPEFDKDELISILVRLERTGLIRELVGMYLGYSGGRYLVNPLFKKFMIYLAEFEDGRK